MTSREIFEAWMCKHPRTGDINIEKNGLYKSSTTRIAWEVWRTKDEMNRQIERNAVRKCAELTDFMALKIRTYFPQHFKK